MWSLTVERRARFFNRVLPGMFWRYRIKVQNEWSYSFTHMEDVTNRGTPNGHVSQIQMRSIIFFGVQTV